MLTKSLVIAALSASLVLVTSPLTGALESGPASSGPVATGVVPAPPRGTIYSQPAAIGFSVNASTEFNSEVADDLPDSLVGRSVGEVTLYVAEWAHWEWVEPLGIIISFYDGTCQPDLAPAVTCSVGWSDLVTELLDESPPTRIVYSATAALPSPVTVTADMSIGAYVVTDWEPQPYAGLTMTAPDNIYGCGQAYWDDEEHGAPRWTPLSDATTISADLAFCLAESGTGIDDAAPVSWSRIKSIYK